MATINLANSGNAATNGAALSAAFGTATSGDIIDLAPGADWALGTNYALPAKTLTVRCSPGNRTLRTDPLGDGSTWTPAATNGTAVTGYLRYGTSTNIEWQELDLTERSWPGTGQSWADISLDTQILHGAVAGGYGARIKLTRSRLFKNYGAGQAAYDPTTKYAEMNSPNPYYFRNDGGITDTANGNAAQVGFGDATWPRFNNIAGSPTGIQGRFTSVILEDSEVHGLSQCMIVLIEQGGVYLDRGCYFHESYNDFRTIATEGNSWASLKSVGSLFVNAFGDYRDGGNPHTDVVQFWGTKASTTVTALVQCEFNNMVYMAVPGCRAQPQGLFLETYTTVGSPTALGGLKVRNCFLLMAQKGVFSNSAYDPYVRNSTFANPDWFANPAGTFSASIGFGILGGPAGGSIDRTRGLIKDTVCEGFGSNQIDLVKSSVANLGAPGSRTLALSSVFASPTTQGATWSAMYTAFRTAGSYATDGPQYSTLRTLLNDRTAFTGETVFVGMQNVTNAIVSTVTSSLPAVVHGGEVGDSLSISAVAGVEWRVLNEDRLTQFATWTSTPGNVAVGKYIQLRLTSSALSSTTVTKSVTVGGVTFPWAVTTKGNLDWPKATKSTGQKLWRTASGAMATPSSSKFIWACNVKIVSGATNFDSMFAGGGNHGPRGFWANSGAGYKLFMEWGSEATGGNLVDTYTPVLTFGVEYAIQLSIDLTQATNAGMLASAIDVSTGLDAGSWTNSTWVQNGLVGFGFAYAANGVTWMDNIPGTLGFLYLNCSECLTALSNNFTPENIGYQGAGITGRRPEIFFPGEIAPNNRGVSGAWALNTGSMTAANAQTWPPVLQLAADVQTAGPYAAGQPIDIIVYAAGRNAPLNLTAATTGTGTFDGSPKAMAEGSNGVVFTYTPTASGSHTISFTNDVGYTNAAGIVLTVTGGPPLGVSTKKRGRRALGLSPTP